MRIQNGRCNDRSEGEQMKSEHEDTLTERQIVRQRIEHIIELTTRMGEKIRELERVLEEKQRHELKREFRNIFNSPNNLRGKQNVQE